MHHIGRFQLQRSAFRNPETFLVALLGCFLAHSAAGGQIHVPAEQPTIQQAIDAATAGDVVIVAPGTYFENLDYKGKAITVRSAQGPKRTIIDGSHMNTVVLFMDHEGPRSVLAGFTIQHGENYAGGGVNMFGASPTIIDNIFRENGPSPGGTSAIFGNISSAAIRRNRFVANNSDDQYGSAVVSFVNDSSPVIADNIFHDNPWRAISMNLPEGNSPCIVNNTIVRNKVGISYDGRFSATHVYYNNIIVANDVGLQVDSDDPASRPTFAHNLVFNNGTNYSGIPKQTGLHGNISAAPLFVNPAGFDYRLQSTSPAIDAGTANLPNLPKADFARRPRVLDGDGDSAALPDIGAFEYVP